MNHRPYQSINHRQCWLRRAWDSGYIHATVGMIIVALLMALIIIMAGVLQ